MVHLHRREILDIIRGCALGSGPFSTHAEHIAQVPLTREPAEASEDPPS